MKIACIGGVERHADRFVHAAALHGHRLEMHPGHVGGRGSDALRAMVQRSELVLVLTDVNSHGAVELARRSARELGKPVILMRRCGLAHFRQLLDAIARRESYLATAAH